MRTRALTYLELPKKISKIATVTAVTKKIARVDSHYTMPDISGIVWKVILVIELCSGRLVNCCGYYDFQKLKNGTEREFFCSDLPYME